MNSSKIIERVNIKKVNVSKKSIEKDDLKKENTAKKVIDKGNVNKLNLTSEDRVVYGTTKLLTKFFDDKILSPIYKRDGIDWHTRKEELATVSNFIIRPENPICVILGVAGSGKTTLLEMLASLSSDEEAKEVFGTINPYYIYSLKLSAIQKLDNYQEYINNLIDDLALAEARLQMTHSPRAKIVLFIDEIHQLTFSMKTGTANGADALKEKLTTLPIGVVGATTRIEFDHAFSNDQAMRERLDVVELPQLPEKELSTIFKNKWEVYHKGALRKQGIISKEKIPNAIVPPLREDAFKELLIRSAMYRPEMGEPRRSLKILEDLAVASVQTGIEVTPQAVLKVFEQRFNIQTEFDVKAIYENVDRHLKGQEFAKLEIKHALNYAKLRSKQYPFKPVMTLLFAGSTGVGKTEATKAIAEVYSKNADGFKTFNMPIFNSEDGDSEFRRLVGEYADHNPNGIILLDEVEKAKNVFNSLLSMTDEGIVDYYVKEKGVTVYRKISLRNNIIIMTSNAGADVLRDNAKLKDRNVEGRMHGESLDMYKRSFASKIGKALKNHLLNTGFTPELYNRFDRVVVFDNLSNKTYLEIGDKVVEDTVKTIEEAFGVKVKVSKKAQYRDLPNEAYDISAFILLTRVDESDTDSGGARGMIKQVGNLISNYLVDFILENDLEDTGKTISVKVGRESRLYQDGVDEFRDELNMEILD